MSRSGYSEDCDNLELYRTAVRRALHGKRGQAFLHEMAMALEALPEKRLIQGELIDETGACCAIGAVCRQRGLDVARWDYEDSELIGSKMGIAWSMAAEIAYMNDEYVHGNETPEQRWDRMRKWVVKQLVPSPQSAASTQPKDGRIQEKSSGGSTKPEARE